MVRIGPQRSSSAGSWLSEERSFQCLRGLSGGVAIGICLGQGVEHHEVVEDALVAHGCHIDARFPQLAPVGLAFITQDIGRR
jgi:hypothetical protein